MTVAAIRVGAATASIARSRTGLKAAPVLRRSFSRLKPTAEPSGNPVQLPAAGMSRAEESGGFAPLRERSKYGDMDESACRHRPKNAVEVVHHIIHAHVIPNRIKIMVSALARWAVEYFPGAGYRAHPHCARRFDRSADNVHCSRFIKSHALFVRILKWCRYHRPRRMLACECPRGLGKPTPLSMPQALWRSLIVRIELLGVLWFSRRVLGQQLVGRRTWVTTRQHH